MKKLFDNPADELIYELAMRDAEPDPDSSGDPVAEAWVPLQFPSTPVDAVDWRERAVLRFSQQLVRRHFSTPSA